MIEAGKFYLKLLRSFGWSFSDVERRSFLTQQLIHSERLVKQRFDEDFIFIHINKTGGSSISDVLGIERHHLSAFTVRNLIGEEAWRSKFKFAFIRNPWDRTVSQYHYRLDANQQGLRDRNLDFKSWVRAVFENDDVTLINSHAMFMPQVDWLTDMDGNIIIDFVGRFERFEEDVGIVLQRLGVQKSIKHLRSSSRGDYRGYYDDHTAQVIAGFYAKDIERFEYCFEKPVVNG